MRIDSSGNVGIGASSPNGRLDVRAASALVKVNIGNNGGDNNGALIALTGSSTTKNWYIGNQYNISGGLEFTQTTTAGGTAISSTPSMLIDDSGNLLVGTTSANGKLTVTSSGLVARFNQTAATGVAEFKNGSDAGYGISFLNSSGSVAGSIYWTATTTTYVTSSDYRLKENVQPMTNGLATVSALNPVTYKWNADDSHGEGFIAHELQAVIPHAVTGEKDAVNKDGSIKPQGVDYSKIVVHLVAACQELKAQNDELKARVAALEGKA
jgi:hypothetical protein